ncbi:MAG: cellulose synthase subunit BcsC-related outer membrane protein [Desulfobacterales bacterium]
MRRRLLPLCFLILSLTPPAGASGQSLSVEQDSAAHDQTVIQRRSGETLTPLPDESRVDRADPPWVYATPEDARVLESKTMPAAGAPAAAAPSDLARAWSLYTASRHAAAAGLFSTLLASETPGEAMNARLGLAYSLARLGKTDQAAAHLSVLVRNGYRLAETQPALVDALIRSGRWDEARRQIAPLPPDRRRAWQRRLVEAHLSADHAALPDGADAATLRTFIETHEKALNRCLRPDLFHAVSLRLRAAGEGALAGALQRRLLGCDLPPALRAGILSDVAAALAPSEAMELVQRQAPLFDDSPPGERAALSRIEADLLKRRLAALPADSPEKAAAARSVLKHSPGDRDALTALAWDAFNRNAFDEADRIFAQLLAQEPDNKEFALGQGYARLNAGRLEAALAPLEQSGIPEDADTQALRTLAYRRQAGAAAEAKDWDRTAAMAEKLLDLDPEDPQAAELMAWARYEQGRHGEARPLMEQAFRRRPEAGLAGGLLGLYSAAGDEAAGFDLASRLARDPDPALRASAAGFFFDRGAPVTAARLDPGPGRCYTNADSPRAEAFLYHRSKQSSGRYSDLEETALPMTLVVPTRSGTSWFAILTPTFLSGDKGPATPRAGRYYQSLNGLPPQRDLADDLFVVQPQVGVELEGRLRLKLQAGATPLSGPVAPTPTLAARLSGANWYVDAHRLPVKDSILSYAGQRDPYSRDEWGRVTRNGIEAGLTGPLGDRWWLSGSAGFDAYTGERVWDNQSVHLDTAVGRTWWRGEDELSAGLFATARHFRHNSDFHTFGHGGYYSPELMTMVGPFVRYRTAACRDGWLDIQAATGWLYQKLDRSPFYPLFDGDTTGFTPAAASEANGAYAADSDHKLGFSLKLQGMRLLTPHIAAGGFAGLDNSSDASEWVVGAGLQIFFEPQARLWKRGDFFREFSR